MKTQGLEKDKKKILIVCRAFYPVIAPRAFRATELAKELARQGHDVTVCFPTEGIDYSSFSQEHNLKIKDMGKLRWKEISLKGGRIQLLLRKMVRRLLQLMIEWPEIEIMFRVASALKNENGYDLLISIAVPYPVHWGVARIRNTKRKIADCWIADCGDPYMGDRTDSFNKLFYFRYVEKWFCRKADYITVPFEGARSAYYPEFSKKIRIIPQGFRLDLLNLPGYQKPGEFPVFGYAGGFIPGKRDPGPLLAWLSECREPFRFVVYTAQTDMLIPAKSVLKEKLEIREIIPREKLLAIMSGMDFLINIDNNAQGQLPSKLIDYAITGRPVLNITSDMNFSVLQEFMDGDYSRKMALEPPDTYDISIVARKFTGLLKSS